VPAQLKTIFAVSIINSFAYCKVVQARAFRGCTTSFGLLCNIQGFFILSMVEQIINLLHSAEPANIDIALAVAKSQNIIDETISFLQSEIKKFDLELDVYVSQKQSLMIILHSSAIYMRKHYIKLLKNA
jgi:hypothetical protein